MRYIQLSDKSVADPGPHALVHSIVTANQAGLLLALKFVNILSKNIQEHTKLAILVGLTIIHVS